MKITSTCEKGEARLDWSFERLGHVNAGMEETGTLATSRSEGLPWRGLSRFRGSSSCPTQSPVILALEFPAKRVSDSHCADFFLHFRLSSV